MAIKDLEKQLQIILNRDKAERLFQYQFLTTRIIANRRFIIKGLVDYSLKDTGVDPNIVTRAVRDTFTLSKAREAARVVGPSGKKTYRVYNSYAKAYDTRLQEWSNSANYTKSDIVSVEGDSQKITFTYFGSYLGSADRAGKASGRNPLRSLLFAALDQIQKKSDITLNKRKIVASFQGLHGRLSDDTVQTTLATTSVAKKLSDLKSSEIPGMETAVDKFAERLFIDYNLGKNTIANLENFSEEFVVEMELGHRRFNSDKRITIADRPAIKKWVDKVSAELLKIYSDPDTAGSTPKGKLVYRLAAENAEKKINKAIRATGGKLTASEEKKEKKGNTKQRTAPKSTAKGKKGKRTVSKKKNTGASALKLSSGNTGIRTQDSAISLKTLLEARLSETVRSKMIQPALVNRTGRFADSVRVGNVIVGPRGGVHIEYTYDRERYGTFEPGGRQGSTNRDPRSLIKRSIREIAMTIVGDKFMTIRRV